MTKKIYLDNAATTSLNPLAKEAMEPFLLQEYGNASTAYELGERAKEAIEIARRKIAGAINANPEEIYFTSGGSEADNWAIKGIAGYRRSERRHIVTSAIEHHAVINSCKYLQEIGYQVSYVNVNSTGLVDMAELEAAVSEDTAIVSIMHGNNEIGTIEPIKEIGEIARRSGAVFHTDAVQSMGQIPIDVRQLPIDMLSASAHKFHGPKGIGFMYVKEGIPFPSYIHGGSQERGKRAGTENVAAIVGMATALEIENDNMTANYRKKRRLRNMFVELVMNNIEEALYNGHSWYRLPGNASFSFKGIDGQMMLVLLEEAGIYASAGSACTTGVVDVSHVINAINVPKEYKKGTLRFSIGNNNTEDEIRYTARVLKENVELLRRF